MGTELEQIEISTTEGSSSRKHTAEQLFYNSTKRLLKCISVNTISDIDKVKF
jgi:hypothetical protein